MNDSSVDTALRRGVTCIDAPLPYIAPSPIPPYRYVEEPPPGVPREVGTLDWKSVPIHAGWPEAASLSLDEHGFAIGRHPTAFDAWWDVEAIKSRYFAEMEARVLAHTGASRAILFDHNVRYAPDAEGTRIGKPARLVHNDYTVRSAPQRVRDLLPPAEAEAALNRRYAFINLWRPIREPLRDAPLALCDARSVAAEDVVTSALIYPDRQGEVYRLTHNPAHRWYYFPDMRVEELIFIKCWDSLDDGRARFSAHTAFDDPSCPPDAPPRQSIEVRSIVFW